MKMQVQLFFCTWGHVCLLWLTLTCHKSQSQHQPCACRLPSTFMCRSPGIHLVTALIEAAEGACTNQQAFQQIQSTMYWMHCFCFKQTTLVNCKFWVWVSASRMDNVHYSFMYDYVYDSDHESCLELCRLPCVSIASTCNCAQILTMAHSLRLNSDKNFDNSCQAVAASNGMSHLTCSTSWPASSWHIL